LVSTLTNYYSAIAIAVGQTITLTTIITEVPKRITEVSPQAVIAAGALGFDTLAATPDALIQLRDIWNLAFTRTMILSLAMICAAVPCALGMEFLNSRKIAEQRKAEAEGEE
jgi:hypothetical protein